MDYKEQWTDMKRWLRQAIDYCDQRSIQTKDEIEVSRLLTKANSLRLVLQHMMETERIYSGIAISEYI